MSLGALTTQFTPPASCLSDNWQIDSTDTQSSSPTPYRYNLYGVPLERASGCFPSNFLPYSTLHYSPAICPSGYSAATQTTSVIISGSLTETTEVCCPTASVFHVQTTNNFNPQFPYVTTLLCESYIRHTTIIKEVKALETSGSYSMVTATWDDGAVNAYGIRVKRNNLDQVSGSPSTSNNSPTGSPSSSPSSPSSSSSSTSTSDTSSTGGSSSNGLSTGASVGIGVSLGIVGLSAIIGAVYLLLKRRKRKTLAERHVEAPGQSYAPFEYYRSDAAVPQEMEGAGMARKFYGTHGTQEMDGDGGTQRWPTTGDPPAELSGTQKTELSGTQKK